MIEVPEVAKENIQPIVGIDEAAEEVMEEHSFVRWLLVTRETLLYQVGGPNNREGRTIPEGI